MTAQRAALPQAQVAAGSIQELLAQMVARRVSDVHLQAGSPPMGRVDGLLVPFAASPLMPPDTVAMARALLTDEQWEDFEYRSEMDTAYSLAGVARFRCNVFRQRGAVGIVMRVVTDAIPSFEALGLPDTTMKAFAGSARGLILVTGPTGSGKSTTLASLIDHINRSQPFNIITIEDPIEILHKNKRSIVVQREVGADTRDFRTALKYALRQDPDVIMIGEMRDKETVEAALSAAQTGHLVFSTLHTMDAMRTVTRIIDFFAPHERGQIRQGLSESLVGVVSQRLLPRLGGGRVLGMEILIGTPTVRDCIKDETKTEEIKQALEEGSLRGMHTFDQHLVKLVREGHMSEEEAMQSATSAHEVKIKLMAAKFA